MVRLSHGRRRAAAGVTAMFRSPTPEIKTPEYDSVNEFHKAIVDNLADGVYFVDPDREIRYWNHGAERITGYESGDIVGRHCFDNILDHVDAEGNSLCQTVCPLAATILDGQPREVSMWLRHADGYRKPVRARTAPVRDGGGTIIGAVEVFSDDSAVLQAAEDADRARHDALTDDLTGLPNRRLFDAALAGRLENLDRYGWQFGLLIVDIDHFKAVNDSHGHAFGDAVLVGVARTLHGAVRGGDVLARWGGEEFAVLVESSDDSSLIETAERLRVLVASSEVRLAGLSKKVRVSVGGALAHPEDTAESLFARADRALYGAKHAGRNRIEIAQPV
jgi:diguanylate cyclase (GGDEF)-like protein/PAS domain S-box-containing protein